MKHALTCICIILFASVAPAAAQIYEEVSEGSSIICGYFPDGKDKLLKKKGKKYDLISKKEATKEVAEKRSEITKHLQTLRELERDLTDADESSTTLTPKQVKELIEIARFFVHNKKPKIGKTLQEQRAQVESLISRYESEKQNIQAELDGINDCLKHNRRISGEATTTVVYFASAARTLIYIDDDVYKPLVKGKYRPPYYQAWCFDIAGFGGPRPVWVAKDPCYIDSNNTADVGVTSCPNFSKRGKLAAFIGPTYGFIGGATPEAITGAINQIRSQVPKRYHGRIRAPNATHVEDIYDDDCSDI